MRPVVSIVLPTYNRLPYLRDAVASVFAQTYRDWELIIADDGSAADATTYLRTLVAEPGVRLIALEHSGNPPAVRNAALREAQGEYIAFLDSDDVWMPSKLELQVASLRSQSARRWSYTGCVMVDGLLNPLAGARAGHGLAADGWILDALLEDEVVVVQSSVVAARELIAAAGGYAEDLPVCGDYDLYVRLAQRSEVDFISEPLVLVRRHNEHYCDDVTALKDLRHCLQKIRRSGIARHMDLVIGKRCAAASAGIARGYAASGQRLRVLGALLSSARYSWAYRDWWYGAMAATVQAWAPASVGTALRDYRRRRLDRGGQPP
jgi:glycosyltransferase involved in cell wall biosynthesis